MRFPAAWFLMAGPSLVACTAAESPDLPESLEYRFEEFRVPVQEGINLYGRIVGYGPDTVIIPASMYLAQDFLPLAEGRTLIFYDLRSRGGSDYVSDPSQIGIEFDVTDLEAVRSALGIERFSLIGWSYLGAMVALYASEHPEHVERVVQIGPMGPRPVQELGEGQRGSVPDPADVEYLTGLLEEGMQEVDPVGYCRAWLHLELLPSVMGRPETVSNTRMDPCIYRNEWPDRVFETLGLAMPPDWDYLERATRVQAPVLTICGSADPSGPIEGGREWVSLFPSGQMLELEGIGHLPWVEAPESFFSEVDAFLRGTASQTGGL